MSLKSFIYNNLHCLSNFPLTDFRESGHTRDVIPRPTRQSPLRFAPLLLWPLLATACLTPDVDLGGDTPGVYREVVNTPARLRDKVDLLFVIDNSENMAARQAELSNMFDALLHDLGFGRGLPDLHIGVVSTDMGVGPYSEEVPQCSSRGDGGVLIAPSRAACAATSDPFLSIHQDDDGSSQANFSGSASEAFACMSALGETGCDYEQPLEAMRSSLFEARAQGLGFVRSDAVLGVVVLTNEDDCSAFNSELFNPDQPRFRGDGPNFRCFQSGVICDGDDVYHDGVRNGCRPRPQSDFITQVEDYVDFLGDLKPDPSSRVVTAIIGDPDLVQVDFDEQNMDAELMASCQDEAGAAAYPGVRLNAFVDAFGENGQSASLCNSKTPKRLGGMVRNLRKSLGTTCLEGPILDIEPDEPGRQVDCRVYEKLVFSDESRTNFPKCDNPGNLEASSQLPCYSIQTGGEACGDFYTQLALQVHGRSTPPNADTRLVAECRVAE